MYRKDYEMMLEHMKTACDLINDYSNMQRCEQSIRCFNRIEAWQCLQDLIPAYWEQIEFFGSLFDGVKIYRNVDLALMNDELLRDQLAYICRHIPVYVLLRKGEEELAKKICEWIDKQVTL